MSLRTLRSSWAMIVSLALLAISTVYAHPIEASTTEDQAHPMPAVQPRDPRLIPDTENYLAAVFDLLGVSVPTPTETTPAATPSETPSETSSPTTVASPLVKAEHGKPINLDATPVIIADGVTYSATIKHENQKPFENIQIGPGYQGSKKLAASDLPIIFAGLETELASRFRDAVDSSDELGLDDVFGF